MNAQSYLLKTGKVDVDKKGQWSAQYTYVNKGRAYPYNSERKGWPRDRELVIPDAVNVPD
jgi:hypothetical protein